MIMYDYYYQACPPLPISDPFLALLSGLDAIYPQTEHYMNFSTARPLLNTYEGIFEGDMFKYNYSTTYFFPFVIAVMIRYFNTQ